MVDSYYSEYKEIQCDPIEITVTQVGGLLSTSITSCVIPIVVSISGIQVVGVSLVNCDIIITVLPKFSGITIENKLDNWVQWAKIGSANFTIDESNEAGKRPLDWKGFVYQLLKLDKSIIAYGENGVSALVPNGVVWGLQNIYKLGLLCRTAVIGNDEEHYFIDSGYRLFKLSKEGLKLLDYSEYLATLVQPILLLNSEVGFLYICDGSHGFVYSTRFNSFGSGPINVTGFGIQSGTIYTTAPAAIVTPTFQITTDIYDLDTRKPKTINNIEIGTDLTNYLEAMIETRLANNLDFIQSPWTLVNPDGRAWINCYGVEFKFHFRSYIYEYFEVDYIKINGMIHQFNYVDNIRN